MSACCAHFEDAANRQFTEEKASAELKRYRDRGPGPTTRLLEDGIARAGALGGTLLDIGSGIGALTFRLLNRGITHAIAVDASSAYVDAARREAERLRRADDVEFVRADFMSVASALPAATVVALDRVVCCYPSYEPLLDAAVQHADRCLALAYPRDVWYVRVGVSIENALRRLQRNSFRMFVHPPAKIDAMIRSAGFTLAHRRKTMTWAVDVYTR